MFAFLSAFRTLTHGCPTYALSQNELLNIGGHVAEEKPHRQECQCSGQDERCSENNEDDCNAHDVTAGTPGTEHTQRSLRSAVPLW